MAGNASIIWVNDAQAGEIKISDLSDLTSPHVWGLYNEKYYAVHVIEKFPNTATGVTLLRKKLQGLESKIKKLNDHDRFRRCVGCALEERETDLPAPEPPEDTTIELVPIKFARTPVSSTSNSNIKSTSKSVPQFKKWKNRLITKRSSQNLPSKSCHCSEIPAMLATFKKEIGEMINTSISQLTDRLADDLSAVKTECNSTATRVEKLAECIVEQARKQKLRRLQQQNNVLSRTDTLEHEPLSSIVSTENHLGGVIRNALECSDNNYGTAIDGPGQRLDKDYLSSFNNGRGMSSFDSGPSYLTTSAAGDSAMASFNETSSRASTPDDHEMEDLNEGNGANETNVIRVLTSPNGQRRGSLIYPSPAGIAEELVSNGDDINDPGANRAETRSPASTTTSSSRVGLKLARSVTAPIHMCSGRCLKLSEKAQPPKHNGDLICLGGNINGNLYIMSREAYNKEAAKSMDPTKRALKLLALLFDSTELSTSCISGLPRTYAKEKIAKSPLCPCRLEILRKQLFEDFPHLHTGGKETLPQPVKDAINTRCRKENGKAKGKKILSNVSIAL